MTLKENPIGVPGVSRIMDTPHREKCMNRYYFIINPVAGAGRASKAFDIIENSLTPKGIDYEYDVSLYPGHAIELTRAALARGEKCIVSVGGDGTLREVAQVMAGTGAALGIVPSGTGNDFAKALGIPMNDAEAALNTLLKGKILPTDAGLANDNFFVNVAGFGFDADTVANTDSFKKKFHGMVPYMLGVIRTLLRLRTLDLKVTANGETFQVKSIMFDAANGTHFGGGMNVAPLADTSDGMLDIIIVKALGRLTFLSLLTKFVKGKHTALPQVMYFKAPEVTVECKQHSLLNMDGELGSGTPATFKVLPGALNIIVPDLR